MFSDCLAEKGASHSCPSHATEADQQGYSSKRSPGETPFGPYAVAVLTFNASAVNLQHGMAGGGQRARVCVTTPTLDMVDRSSSQLLSQSICSESMSRHRRSWFCRISRDIPRLTIDNRTNDRMAVSSSMRHASRAPRRPRSFGLNSHADSKIRWVTDVAREESRP